MLYAFFWEIPQRLWILYANVSEHAVCSIFIDEQVHTYPPMKMEQTECSEMLAYKIQMTRNYPEESIQHERISLKVVHNLGVHTEKVFQLCTVL